MTIEEKAKAYDEALEKAKSAIKDCGDNKGRIAMIESIFPAIYQSEDERIRKCLIDFFEDWHENRSHCWGIAVTAILAWLEKQGDKGKLTHEDICKAYNIPDIGEFSDGYHTFNSLYKQRMVLFAVLVKTYKDKAWKSWKHEDGLDCFGGGWFIVGIDTPDGTYTYHYEAKDWDRFDCQILEKAKHWDGHDEFDVERLFSLVNNTNKDEVIKCLINGMQFYYEDNEEATWGTEKYSMKVKDILAWLEKQGESYTKKDIDDAYLKGICDAKHELEKQGEQKPILDFKASNFYVSKVDGKIHDMTYNPADKVEPFDKYEGLTDFERTLADICIGWIGEELGWKQYIKDNADVLLKIAIKKFNSIQDAPFKQKPAAWSEEDELIVLSIKQVIQCASSLNLVPEKLDKIDKWLKSLKDRIGE